MHIFPYSVREGTLAADLTNRVPDSVKNDRCHIMLEKAAEMKKVFCEKYIGKTVNVLFEQKKDGAWSGMTANYVEVRKKSDENLRGKIQQVRISGYDSERECLTAE